MCELFALSGDEPALLRYSLHEFASHGAGDRNADGWGVAHYVDGDVRLVKEVGSARDSACLQFIESHPIRSELVISHIRHATQGRRILPNSQPFVRELGGRVHVFAHNGHLDRDRLASMRRGGCFSPVGDTDSELAFCALLGRLRELAWTGAVPPSAQRRLQVVVEVARELRALGPANFLYADGEFLFAHGHRRTQVDGVIRPPGLHMMCSGCLADPRGFAAPGLQVGGDGAGGGRVAFASVPLTDSPDWRPLVEGAVVMVRGAEVLEVVEPDPPPR